MKNPKKNQAPVVDEKETTEEKTEKVELTKEQKKEKIHSLLISLQKAKDEKEIPAQKKIRRNLRKLGFFISKEKESMMDALLETDS